MANNANKITKSWVVGDLFLADDQENLNKGTINTVIDDNNKHHTFITGSTPNSVSIMGSSTVTTGVKALALGESAKVAGDYSAILGGTGNELESTSSAIIGGVDGHLTSTAVQSVILGGDSLNGTQPFTAYAQRLNVKEVPTGTQTHLLAVDANGYVIQGIASTTDTFVTGGTLDTSAILKLRRNDGTYASDIDLSVLSGGTGTVTNADNGLHLSGDTIKQGGDLTQDTTIELTGNTYMIKEGDSTVADTAEGLFMYVDDTFDNASLIHLNAEDLTIKTSGTSGTDKIVLDSERINLPTTPSGTGVKNLALDVNNNIVTATNGVTGKGVLRLNTPVTQTFDQTNWDIIQYDHVVLSRNGVTANSTNKNITITKDGWYEVTFGVEGIFAAADVLELMVYVNDVEYSPNPLDTVGEGNGDPIIMTWTSTVQLTGGDVIDVRGRNHPTLGSGNLSFDMHRLYLSIKEDL